MDWTPDLHRRFVQAIEQLGIDQAIPSKILELMKVEGLTRHNIASHLQVNTMNTTLILIRVFCFPCIGSYRKLYAKGMVGFKSFALIFFLILFVELDLF